MGKITGIDIPAVDGLVAGRMSRNADASADTPDVLEMALDQKEYRAGDTMQVAVTARVRHSMLR